MGSDILSLADDCVKTCWVALPILHALRYIDFKYVCPPVTRSPAVRRTAAFTHVRELVIVPRTVWDLLHPHVLTTAGLFTFCNEEHQLQPSDASARGTQLRHQSANPCSRHLEPRMLRVLSQ